MIERPQAGDQTKDLDCPLCRFVGGEESSYNNPTDVVFETDDVLAYISPKWWRNNPGNVIVIPKSHFKNIYDIPDELLAKVQVIGKKLAIAMKSAYECDGISFRQHNERDGGQEIDHYHLHVFPRWKDDNLYLNHNDCRFVPAEERAPYAEKLRKYLSS